jgi:ligand-binding SRPBCC domain-containing protein
MKFSISTIVEQGYEKVFNSFNQELFIKLKPPGIGLKILRFEGCKTNDIVELELDFIFFKQYWKSTIIEDSHNDQEIYFIDSSTSNELPFFLKKWKHKHRIIKHKNGSKIIDEIDFRAPYGLDILIFPMIWAQMAWRKPIYRKFFRNVI